MNLITMKKIKLPRPLPQSYISVKKFVLENKDKIKVVKKGEGRGTRFYVSQEDVDRLCEEMFQ